MSDTIARQRTQPSPLAEIARYGYLDRYSGGTRDLYEYDLQVWFDWCSGRHLDPLDARRADLEAFGRWLMSERNNGPRSACRRLQTIRAFYKLAAADDIIQRDPTVMMQMPKWTVDYATIAHTTPKQVSAALEAAVAMSPSHVALIALMAYLGLRVSEVCSLRVEDFQKHPLGYLVVTVTRKGGAVHTVPVPVPLKRIIKQARAGRKSGPLLITRASQAQNRRGAYDWVKRICGRAGLPDTIHPHSFRHGAAKMLLAAGMTIEQVQHFMGHKDIRTTMHYARQEYGLDQHGAHRMASILAAA